jgi:hypothetical protein
MSGLMRIGFVALVCAAAPLPTLAAEAAAVRVKPAHVEAVPGSSLKKVVLTPKAAERLDIRTGEVREDPAGRRIVPYAAVVYDLSGVTWVYTNPEPLTFIRQQVKLDQIKNENAFLEEGPAVGTKILTLGVPQIYGAEVGVGH